MNKIFQEICLDDQVFRLVAIGSYWVTKGIEKYMSVRDKVHKQMIQRKEVS